MPGLPADKVRPLNKTIRADRDGHRDRLSMKRRGPPAGNGDGLLLTADADAMNTQNLPRTEPHKHAGRWPTNMRSSKFSRRRTGLQTSRPTWRVTATRTGKHSGTARRDERAG